MIAYNNHWLYNLYVHQQADEALHEQCIKPGEHNVIIAGKEAGFYTPNIFVRIGLAILTLVIATFVGALFALMFSVKEPGYLLLFFGIICYAFAEMFISQKKHYNSGVDNILVWLAGLLLWLGIYVIVEWQQQWYGNNPAAVTNHDIQFSFAAFLICLALVLRFADTLMSIAATIALFCFVFYCYQHTGTLAIATTPFMMMLLSGLLYYMSNKALELRSMLLYHNCLRCVNVVALVALYASGNYYLVRELSNEMFNLGLRLQDPLPMGWFFWLWTFIVPFVYIGTGIRKRDITLIRTGIPLIAAAVFTFRYYHSILSPEMAMMIGGLLLFMISYSLINYLREPKAGFTFRPENKSSDQPEIGKLITGEFINNSAHTDNHSKDVW